MKHKYRIIILGAGFSKPAGIPLAAELWEEIRKTASAFPSNLRANKFNTDLDRYIRFRRDAAGEELTPATVDFEDFMRFLDVEHFLRLRGSDTWSPDGNEGTIVTKYLIGKILARHVSALETVPELYLQFAKSLEPNDYILTFNYDTLLEISLDAIGKPYRLFPNRFKNINSFYNTLDLDRNEIIILKMHGSIDWFDRTEFEHRIAENKEHGSKNPTDIIFSNETVLGLERIVDGPRPDSDPLKNIYRARNLNELYKIDHLFLATPRILPPSSMKLLYYTGLNNFWEGIENAGSFNFGMSIIGFSLPEHDEYARQILYNIVNNYQSYNTTSKFGEMKQNISIIDFFKDKKSERNFRNRYRFVDWSRAHLSGEGFNIESLKHIFR